MLDFLDNLRRRSVSERQRIVWGVSLGITFLIFIVWLSFLFPSVESSPDEQIVDEEGGSILGSLSIVTDNIASIYKTTKDDVGKFWSAVASSTEK